MPVKFSTISAIGGTENRSLMYSSHLSFPNISSRSGISFSSDGALVICGKLNSNNEPKDSAPDNRESIIFFVGINSPKEIFLSVSPDTGGNSLESRQAPSSRIVTVFPGPSVPLIV